MSRTQTVAGIIGIVVLGALGLAAALDRESTEHTARDPNLYAEDYLGRLLDQEVLRCYVDRHIEYLQAGDRLTEEVRRTVDDDGGRQRPLFDSMKEAEERRDALLPTLEQEALRSGLDPLWVLIRSELRAKRIHQAQVSKTRSTRAAGK